MILTTERLVLRPVASTDLETTHAYAGNPQNTRYMMFLPHETQAETAQMLRDAAAEWQKPLPRSYDFAVTLKGTHIGAVSLFLNQARTEGKLGWIIHRDYWNCGYATEAARAVIAFARDELKLTALRAQCDARNLSSARVMEKLGMTLISADGTRAYPRRPETARELTYRVMLSRE